VISQGAREAKRLSAESDAKEAQDHDSDQQNWIAHEAELSAFWGTTSFREKECHRIPGKP